MCRTVHTAQRPISLLLLLLMQMATVPNFCTDHSTNCFFHLPKLTVTFWQSLNYGNLKQTFISGKTWSFSVIRIGSILSVSMEKKNNLPINPANLCFLAAGKYRCHSILPTTGGTVSWHKHSLGWKMVVGLLWNKFHVKKKTSKHFFWHCSFFRIANGNTNGSVGGAGLPTSPSSVDLFRNCSTAANYSGERCRVSGNNYIANVDSLEIEYSLSPCGKYFTGSFKVCWQVTFGLTSSFGQCSHLLCVYTNRSNSYFVSDSRNVQ